MQRVRPPGGVGGRDHMEKCFCHKIGCLSPYVRFGHIVAKVDVRSG